MLQPPPQGSLFLMGAGFNVDAAHEAGPVYGNSIHVGRYQMDCGYPLVADVARLCFDLDRVPEGKSIEDLFWEALESNDYSPLTKLSDRLMEADFRLATRLSSSERSNCYRDFFEAFAGWNFLTFNYDSLPEIFLLRSKRWYPHDGYGVPVEIEPSFGATITDGQKSTSLVLHLHGSFCVYTSEDEIRRSPGEAIAWLERRERPRYLFDPDSISLCFPSYRRAMSSTGRVPIDQRVIAPIPEKTQDLNRPFIGETYAKACSLVRVSGTLVAVGYSFNRHDSASYGRILEALCESRDRMLFVVSPQARDLAKRIAAEYSPLQVKPIEKTFKGWAADSFRC